MPMVLIGSTLLERKDGEVLYIINNIYQFNII